MVYKYRIILNRYFDVPVAFDTGACVKQVNNSAPVGLSCAAILPAGWYGRGDCRRM